MRVRVGLSTILVVWAGLFAPGWAEEAVKAPLAVESLLLDGAAAGSRLVVVGERGHILTSTDDGASWTQAEVPTRVLLTALHMHDERTGWAVGHDAVILRTVDGGESWTLAHQAPEEELPLLDVWFRDERTGFAVGAYGYFLATKDGGETWTSRTISEDDFHLNALIPVPRRRPGPQDAEPQDTGAQGAGAQDPGPQGAGLLDRETQGSESQQSRDQRPRFRRLYIAAEAGVAYRSDDGGETWRELPSPYAGSWFGGLALDEDRVLLTGLRGHLYRSEGRGRALGAGAHRNQRDPHRCGADAVRLDRDHRTGGERADQRRRRAERVGPRVAFARGDLGRTAARGRRGAADRGVRSPALDPGRVAT